MHILEHGIILILSVSEKIQLKEVREANKGYGRITNNN